MAKLTASQMAAEIGVSVYTLNRWYKWYNQVSKEKLDELKKKGMPRLPQFELIGSTNWKYWDSGVIEQLKAFKEWMPHTRAGVMSDINKKGKE